MTEPSFLDGPALEERAFGFRIDEEKAFAKLRDYRIAEPERYVLEFVLAGLASGATRVDVETGVWNIALEHDGITVDRDELEGLYHHLIETGDAGTTHLAHLASGFIALSHLRPRWVRLTSDGVRLEERFSADRPPERTIETADVTRPELTHIAIGRRRRFALRQLLGLRPTDEETVIRERAVLCPAEVRVDGEVVEVRRPDLCVSMEISEGPIRGVLGLTRDYRHDMLLTLCYRGVAVIDRTYQGIGGVLSSDEVRRNISLNDLVQDDAHQALLDTCRHARPRLERLLAKRLLDEIPADAARDDPLVHRLLARMATSRHIPETDPVRARLLELPVLRTLGGARISIAELLAEIDPRHPYSLEALRTKQLYRAGPRDRTPAVTRVKGRTVVWEVAEVGEQETLARLLRRISTDVTGELEGAAAEARFRAQPQETPVLRDIALLRASIDRPGIRGELVLQAIPEAGRVRLLWERRRLGSLRTKLPMGVQGIVDADELRPNKVWTQALKSPELEAVERAVGDAIADLCVQAAAQLEAERPQVGPKYVPSLRAFVIAQHLGGFLESIPPTERPDAPVLETLAEDRRLRLAEARSLRSAGSLRQLSPAVRDRLGEDVARELLAQRHDPAHVVVQTAGVLLALVGEVDSVDGPLERAWALEKDGTRRHAPRARDAFAGIEGGIPTVDDEWEGATFRMQLASDATCRLAWYRGDLRVDELEPPLRFLPPGVHAWVSDPELPLGTDFEHVDSAHPRARSLRGVLVELARSLAPSEPIAGAESGRVALRWLTWHYAFDARDAWNPATHGLKRRDTWLRLRGGSPVQLCDERLEPPEEWLTRPLFRQLGGLPLSLVELLRDLPSTGRIPSVNPEVASRTAGAVGEDAARVLVLDAEEAEALAHLVAFDDISDSWMEQNRRAALLAACPSSDGTLPTSLPGPRQRFVQRVPRMGSMSGELVVCDAARQGVELYADGHIVGRWEWTAPFGPCRAIVTAEHLPMEWFDREESVPDNLRDRFEPLLREQARRSIAAAVRDGVAPPSAAVPLLAALIDQPEHRRVLRALVHGRPVEVEDDWRRPLVQARWLTRLDGEAVSPVRALEGTEPVGLVMAADLHELDAIAEASPGGLPGDTLLMSSAEHHILSWLSESEMRLRDRVADARLQREHTRQLAEAPLLDVHEVPSDALLVRTLKENSPGDPYGTVWLPPPDAEQTATLELAIGGHRAGAQLALYPLTFAVRARVTSSELRPGDLDPDGPGLPRLSAVMKAVDRAAWSLLRRLVREATALPEGHPRLVAARRSVLGAAQRALRIEGIRGVADAPDLYEAEIFERGDGRGRVSMRVLVEDHAADGEVGWLNEPAPSPAILGRDLAIVVRDDALHEGMRTIFGDGWVDYGPRVAAAPLLTEAEQVRALLDKTARRLIARSARTLAATWLEEAVWSPDAADAPWLRRDGERLVVNIQAPLHRLLVDGMKAGGDPGPNAWVAIAAVMLSAEPARLSEFLLAIRSARYEPEE